MLENKEFAEPTTLPVPTKGAAGNYNSPIFTGVYTVEPTQPAAFAREEVR